MVATESAASFYVVEEFRRIWDELLDKHPVKYQIRPEVVVMQDDRIPQAADEEGSAESQRTVSSADMAKYLEEELGW
jgi:hypothetical protein